MAFPFLAQACSIPDEIDTADPLRRCFLFTRWMGGYAPNVSIAKPPQPPAIKQKSDKGKPKLNPKKKHRSVCQMDDWQKIKASNDKVHGFTLIELLAAAAIIGVLVTLATPRYRAFVARTRQAEAKNNLGMLGKLQHVYFLHTAGFKSEGHTYEHIMIYGGAGKHCGDGLNAGGNALGFRLSDCSKARYTYGVWRQSVGLPLYLMGDVAYTALPVEDKTRIYPSCNKQDNWVYLHTGGVSLLGVTWTKGELVNNKDVVTECTQ